MMHRLEKAIQNNVLRFWGLSEASANVAARRRQIERLKSKSDADLAKLGIRRDQIEMHVFGDLYYV